MATVGLLWVLALLLHSSSLWSIASASDSNSKNLKLIVVTVATEETDGYLRFMKSAQKYGHSVKVCISFDGPPSPRVGLIRRVPFQVLGMGEEWKGGDVRLYTGGGQKVKLLRRGLEQYKTAKDTLVLFTDR